jgi:hypothetical protein
MYIILVIIILVIFYLTFSNIEKFESSNIYVFYHIYCNGYTLEVLKDQINKIIFSGLYDKCNKIFCFLVGEDEYIKICIDYINNQGKKFSIEAVDPNNKSFERFTLLKIKKYINDNDKFLYIHTKGITKNNNVYVTDWRNIMEYFLIYKFNKCLDELDNHDTVGINYIPGYHYSGNFWWTKGSYYKKLSDTIPNYYTAPEDYICTANPKLKSLHNTNIDHYKILYPIKNYIDVESL